MAGFINYVEAHKNAKYNLWRYNCTDFATRAVAAAGFTPPSDLRDFGITNPSTLYKRLFVQSSLGDRSATTTPLPQAVDGKRHLSRRSTKKLNKKLDRRAPIELNDRIGLEMKLPDRPGGVPVGPQGVGPVLRITGFVQFLDRVQVEDVFTVDQGEEAFVQRTGREKDMWHELIINGGPMIGWLSRIDLNDAEVVEEKPPGKGGGMIGDQLVDPNAVAELNQVLAELDGAI